MMTVLVILPFWTSYLLRVYAWMTILGERGLINRTLMGVGILDEPVRFLLYNNYAVVLVSVHRTSLTVFWRCIRPWSGSTPRCSVRRWTSARGRGRSFCM